MKYLRARVPFRGGARESPGAGGGRREARRVEAGARRRGLGEGDVGVAHGVVGLGHGHEPRDALLSRPERGQRRGRRPRHELLEARALVEAARVPRQRPLLDERVVREISRVARRRPRRVPGERRARRRVPTGDDSSEVFCIVVARARHSCSSRRPSAMPTTASAILRQPVITSSRRRCTHTSPWLHCWPKRAAMSRGP